MEEEQLQLKISEIFTDQILKNDPMYPKLYKIYNDGESLDKISLYLMNELNMMKKLNKFYTDGIEEIIKSSILLLEREEKIKKIKGI